MRLARTMYRLVFENRAEPREPFVTAEPLLIIGREPACHLRLLDNGISDRHAAIERLDDGYYVRDLDSANGIRVNGQMIHQQRLATGDELEVGSMRLLFEIVHAPHRRRFSTDPLQLASIGVVTVSILAQLAVLGWIFSQPRQRDMPIDSADKPRSEQPSSPGALRPAASLPPLASASPYAPVPPDKQTVEPAALNRMIRIVRVDRADGVDGVTLTIAARAQVGERDVDAAATAICVQFFLRDAAGRVGPARDPLWLKIPRWENFTPQTFSAIFRGPASQLAGYVVRTYYRRQLQDVAAVPSTLLSAAPNPIP
jgi:hypothetical protein